MSTERTRPDPRQPEPPATGLRTDATPHLQAATRSLGLDRPLQGPSPITTATLALPKGGGALASIAEQFQANPATGSGSFSIPLTLTAARGLEPQLALSYSSGAGHSPFGLGWDLSPGAICRQTDKRLPRYEDTRDEDSDVFVLGEDLVPALVETSPGVWEPDEVERSEDGHAWRVRRYRPRTEGAFSLIERWWRADEPVFHWRVRDRANVERRYGQTAASRLADPADPRRVFCWSLDAVADDRGNRVVLSYLTDDASRGVAVRLCDHARRTGAAPFTQLYLRSVRYGNATPGQDDTLFEVLFDYGDVEDAGTVDGLSIPGAPTSDFPERPDPFSSCREGFEVRTRWRCRRIILRHHLTWTDGAWALDPAGDAIPVRAWELGYSEDLHLSRLVSVRTVGFQAGEVTWQAQAAPPVTFGYQEPVFGATVEVLRPTDAALLSLSGTFQLLDLDSEGLPGLLTTQADAWHWQPGHGDPARREGVHQDRPRFGPLTTLTPAPSMLRGGEVQLADIDGDGRLEAVLRAPAVQWTSARTGDAWDEPRVARAALHVDPHDPAVRWLDADGDGRADLIELRQGRVRWWRSLGREGWTWGGEATLSLDEASAPVLLGAAAQEVTFLADMNGDGLPDVVRVRATEVCYWPHLGHGRFGPRVVLEGCPRLADFDPTRVRLADVDGSGPADLLYFDDRGLQVARNLSGNRFAAPVSLPLLGWDPHTPMEVTDLQGDGTACLVWSSPRPSDAHAPVRYVRLMAEGKPHLLTTTHNGQGLETRLRYAPSTQWYVRDRDAGTPWATKLPFPVHCLEQMEVVDHVRGHSLTTRYAYHHGFYDGVEREFRGFGRVDQWDSEAFANLTGSDLTPVTPVRTTTWFHTGAFFERRTLEEQFGREYFREDPTDPSSPPPAPVAPLLTEAATPTERREATRALRGQLLRQEVWRDAADASVPYLVTTPTLEVVCRQMRQADHPGVYQVLPRGTLTLTYDEVADDPRMTQQLVLAVDPAYGTPLTTAAVAYPRRVDHALLGGAPSPQDVGLVAVSTQDVVHDQAADRLRLDIPWQQRAWEVGGLTFPEDHLPWTWADLAAALAATTEVAPHATPPTSGAWRRLLSQQVLRYADPTAPGTALPLGEAATPLLVHDSHTLVFTTDLFDTSGLLTRAGWSGTERDAALAAAGYTTSADLDPSPPAAFTPPTGAAWAPSGHPSYGNASTFYQPQLQTDPFGTTATLTWDLHHLRMTTVEVSLGGPSHTASVVLDASTLQPAQLTDLNGVRTAVTFDALGRVTKTATLGRSGTTVDDLDHPTAAFDYTFATFTDGAWTPACAHARVRRTHWGGATPDDGVHDEVWSYTDGLGRPLMSKAPVAPDPATPTTPRYVGTGRVLLDAKGQPVKQYEPYFSSTSGWEPEGGFEGVTPVLHYDPLGRPVRTDHPDGTHERIERTPWEERHFDRNDTVPTVPDVDFVAEVAAGTWVWPDFEEAMEPAWAAVASHPWLLSRAVATEDPTALPPVTAERAAALRQSALQAYSVRDTPTVVHTDVLGRPFLEQRSMSTDDPTATTDIHVTLDLQGRATTIAARYLPDGATTRADQLATTDVFDLLGRSWRHVRRDAQSKVDDEAVGGTTWVLPALDGQPLLRWDSRDQRFRTTFDALRRPTATFVQPGSGPETCLLFTRYGEEAPDAQAHHLYGQAWRVYDTAGLVTTDEVDVDGQVTQSTRRLVLAYHPLPDWSAMAADPDTASEPAWIPTADGTSTEVFTQTATFDLSGRPLHDTIGRDPGALHERRYGYDAGGRLTSVEVRLPAATAWTPVVHDIAYNARGQREAVTSGNDAGTATLQSRYHYDPQSFRLLALQTGRLADTKVLQDLRYVHDAGGNITFIESRTDDTVYYDNAEVTPHRSFTYDALDRLIMATGREHDSTYDPSLNFPGSRRQTGAPYGLGPVAHKADGTALRPYTQTYTYDAVGNFLELRHEQGGMSGATSVRTYAYEVESDGTLFNNQLHSTTVGATDYPLSYDRHGNMTTMSHLHAMAWDSLDRLQSVQTQLRTAPDPSDPPPSHPQHDWFYVYDGGGQRVRKVKAVLIEYDPTNAPGIVAAEGEARQEERLYIGPFEIWRSYDGAGDTEDELETLHVMDGERRISMVETVTWTDGEAVEDLEPKWRYQLDDHLGTSCGEVTEAGLVIGWEEYHPYGTTALWSFDGTREVSGKRYRYTGMERDEETGLQYHTARYFIPTFARWMSVDPVVRAASGFEYGTGSPVGHSDRNGKDPADDERPLEIEVIATSALRGFLKGLGVAVGFAVAAALMPEAALVLGGLAAVAGAVSLFQNRREIMRTVRHIASGRATLAEQEAFGEGLGTLASLPVGAAGMSRVGTGASLQRGATNLTARAAAARESLDVGGKALRRSVSSLYQSARQTVYGTPKPVVREIAAEVEAASAPPTVGTPSAPSPDGPAASALQGAGEVTVASRGAPKAIDPATLPVPHGMSKLAFGKLIGWTKAGTLDGNLAATKELIAGLPGRIGALKEAGVTSEMAEAWAGFYRHEAARVPHNPNALPRAQLMEALAEHLK